jgi:hypothetical protein
MAVLEAIGLALSAISAVSPLFKASPRDETEARIRSAYDESLKSLRSEPRWSEIEPIDESFLTRESNWQRILEEALGLNSPLTPEDLDLSRFDHREPDDPSLAGAFLNAFHEAVARDAVLSTLATVKRTAATVERTLGSEPSRRALLEEAIADSRKRIIVGLLAAGIPTEAALSLAEALPSRRPLPGGALAPGTVRVLVAPVGAGKSAAAEGAFQQATRTALGDPAALPIWLDSRTITRSSLFDQVRDRVVRLGNPDPFCLTLIVDGLDELDTEHAERVLDESRALAATDRAAVLLTTRPLPLSVRSDEWVDLPHLSKAETLSLVSLGAGRVLREWDMAQWPDSIREAAVLPLFALLTGLWLRDNPFAPATTAELVDHLVRRALKGQGDSRTYAESERWLMVLAAQSTAAGSTIAQRDLPHVGDLDPLLHSGLVMASDGNVGFVLALLREWFAARALLTGAARVEDLVAHPDSLSRWRGALRVLLGVAPTAFIHEVLKQLVVVDPGLVGELVESGASRFSRSGAGPSLPDALVAGTLVREATVAFHDALGELGEIVTPTDENGSVSAFGAYVDDPMLSIAWYREPPQGQQVVAMAREQLRLDGPGGLERTHILTAAPGSSPAWPWLWAHEEIKRTLTQIFKSGAPVLDGGPITEEAVWASAKMVQGRGWNTDPVSVADLIRQMGNLPGPEDASWVGSSACISQPILVLRPALEKMQAEGTETILPPWPLSDTRPDGKSTYVWDWFSPEQLRSRVECVYSGALEAYERLSTGLLAPLSPHLRRAVLSPVHLRFYLELSEEGWPGPGGTWHLLPLPQGSKSYATVEIVEERPSWEALSAEARQAAEGRADLTGVAVGNVTSTIIHVFGKRPITKVCYQWLVDDLALIHWTEKNTRVDLG